MTTMTVSLAAQRLHSLILHNDYTFLHRNLIVRDERALVVVTSDNVGFCDISIQILFNRGE